MMSFILSPTTVYDHCMMRRKSKEKKQEQPTSTTTGPQRPPELKKALDSLADVLIGKAAHVAPGYGFAGNGGNNFGPRPEAAWRLYVFTNVEAGELSLPSDVMGFPVELRPIPSSL